jgi:hypothetical protein
MGWLTGQRHKHVTTNEMPTIRINFDHECLIKPKPQSMFPFDRGLWQGINNTCCTHGQGREV